MWLFTRTGFISAVLHDDGIHARSRDAESLASLALVTGEKIIKTPLSDYPYRIIIDRRAFRDWVADQARNIDYSNFKSKIAITRGYEFAKPLHEVWSVMHDVEDTEARIR